MPLSPSAFLAIATTNFTQKKAFFGEKTPPGALVETYDIGGDFYPGNGSGSPALFTAPSDGRYYFCIHLTWTSVSNGFRLFVRITTPAAHYEDVRDIGRSRQFNDFSVVVDLIESLIDGFVNLCFSFFDFLNAKTVLKSSFTTITSFRFDFEG